MNLQEKIKKWIKETLNVEGDFSIEYPMQMSHGDFSTNVAMVCSSKVASSATCRGGGKNNKNPIEIAQEFVQKLNNNNKLAEISKIEVAGPGFINFRLSPEVFSDVISDSIKFGVEVGKNKKLSGKKFLVEYTDPNPFKEFHIGHLMSNAIGEAISRIIATEGAEVKRLSYGGDVGLHVAKAMFAVLSKKDEIENIKNKSKKEQLEFWAQSYVSGSTLYTENESAKKEIDVLNKTIFDKSDKEINELYDWGRNVSIDFFQEIFKRLGTKFDKNFWESEVVEDALKAVSDGLEKKILEQSEGAVVFKGEEYGLHTRVFVNSKGVPTYEAKELGLGIKKYEMYSFDKSVVITGNEQNDYFKVVLKATELIKPEVSGKTVHIGHGMLRFATGKMSSRTGNVITAVSLMSDIKDLVLEKMKDREMSEEKKDLVAEQVMIGAVKYSILKQTPGKDIIFDSEKSVSFEGDSGPYLQYATVRANSILKKSEVSKMPFDTKIPENWQTTDLERMIERFGSVVRRAGDEYAPHYIVTHLIQLASEFNSFYAQNKIIDVEDKTSPYKLAITRAFVNVMTTGLNLLAIPVPDEM